MAERTLILEQIKLVSEILSFQSLDMSERIKLQELKRNLFAKL